jgi:hypothetical protein
MNTFLYIWEVKTSKIPLALIRMATNHISLKLNKSVKFYKLLGTGKGETFTPKDANLKVWALLFVADSNLNNSRIIKRWRKDAIRERFYLLSPLSSHGSWGKKTPFIANQLQNSNSEIAVITRARIKSNLAIRFWKAVPPVVKSLRAAPGLKFAIGIGESPIGLQGTFSIWDNAKSLEEFAFRNEAHAKVIKETRTLDWYSEELFARFEVLSKAE